MLLRKILLLLALKTVSILSPCDIPKKLVSSLSADLFCSEETLVGGDSFCVLFLNSFFAFSFGSGKERK